MDLNVLEFWIFGIMHYKIFFINNYKKYVDNIKYKIYNSKCSQLEQINIA